MTEKALRKAAIEIQNLMGLDPAIDATGTVEEIQAAILADAIPQIQEGDVFTPATQAIIDELSEVDAEEPTPMPAKKKVVTAPAPVAKKKAAPVVEEEDDDDDDDEPTPVAKKKHAPAPVVDDDDDDEVVAPVKRAAAPVKRAAAPAAVNPLKKKVVAAPVVEEDDDEVELKPTKKDKAATSKDKADRSTPFKGTIETLGTSRMIECAKAMQTIKGAQTLDVVAAAADKAFIKAGGTSNVKQSKNIIKVLLPAAEEWGIVVDNGGKLSNQ